MKTKLFYAPPISIGKKRSREMTDQNDCQDANAEYPKKKIRIETLEELTLTNNDRKIMKRAIFNCCQREWKRVINPLETNMEQTCNSCRRLVSPRLEEWSKRWFGWFKCTSKYCGRTWTSSCTWTVDNQIQTTQCQNCRTSVLPYQLVSYKNIVSECMY